MADRTTAAPASSRMVVRRAVAARGRKNGRIGRSDVARSANGRHDEEEADQQEHVVAVPEGGPEAPDPAEEEGHGQCRARSSQPTDPRRVWCGVQDADGAQALEVGLRQAGAGLDDQLALLDVHDRRLDGGGGLLPSLLGGRRRRSSSSRPGAARGSRRRGHAAAPGSRARRATRGQHERPAGRCHGPPVAARRRARWPAPAEGPSRRPRRAPGA